MFAVAMIIVGLLIGVGAFIFGAYNMLNTDSFDEAFRNHIQAMVVMAVGGLISTIGFVIGGWQVLQELIK